MINWQSQLCADWVAFNSNYHRESWFAVLPNLLKHFPDYNYLELIPEVEAKSVVLPVGIRCAELGQPTTEQPGSLPEFVEGKGSRKRLDDQATLHANLPLIVWNQRWEYDKRPDLFFELLYRLQDAGIEFRVAVAGENFRNVPSEFEEAQSRLAEQIIHWGYIESYRDYVSLLQRADLVISTAIHEFFGISILEAIVAGVFPLLPNRLSYPELIPETLHAACLYRNDEELFQKACQRLQSPRKAPPSLQRHIQNRFDWTIVARQVDTLLTEMVVEQ